MQELKQVQRLYSKNLMSYLQTRQPAWDSHLIAIKNNLKTISLFYSKNQLSFSSKELQAVLNVQKALKKHKKKPVKIIQILILIHRLLLQGYIPDIDLETVTGSSKYELHKSLDLAVLINDLLIPKYFLYLKKRCLFEEEKKFIQIENHSNSPIFKLYQIVNLIKSGLSFTKELKHLIRYYEQKYGFVYDLNMVLALDFKQLYELISFTFTQTLQFMDLALNQSAIGCQSLIKNLMDFLNEVQKLNQQISFIYCNHYHDFTVKKYLPNLIDCQKSQLKIQEIFFMKGIREENKNVKKTEILEEISVCSSLYSSISRHDECKLGDLSTRVSTANKLKLEDISDEKKQGYALMIEMQECINEINMIGLSQSVLIEE